MNFDFRKRPLDLLCSNVKGGAFSSGNSILMQRERGKKRDKSKKEKSSGRSAKFGGTEAGGAVSSKYLSDPLGIWIAVVIIRIGARLWRECGPYWRDWTRIWTCFASRLEIVVLFFICVRTTFHTCSQAFVLFRNCSNIVESTRISIFGCFWIVLFSKT